MARLFAEREVNVHMVIPLTLCCYSIFNGASAFGDVCSPFPAPHPHDDRPPMKTNAVQSWERQTAPTHAVRRYVSDHKQATARRKKAQQSHAKLSQRQHAPWLAAARRREKVVCQVTEINHEEKRRCWQRRCKRRTHNQRARARRCARTATSRVLNGTVSSNRSAGAVCHEERVKRAKCAWVTKGRHETCGRGRGWEKGGWGGW